MKLPIVAFKDKAVRSKVYFIFFSMIYFFLELHTLVLIILFNVNDLKKVEKKVIKHKAMNYTISTITIIIIINNSTSSTPTNSLFKLLIYPQDKTLSLSLSASYNLNLSPNCCCPLPPGQKTWARKNGPNLLKWNPSEHSPQVM